MMTRSDVPELTKIIATYSSWRVWCSELKISEPTCNRLKFAGLHYSENTLEVAEAYLKEIDHPCWEDIVRVLCKMNLISSAKALADKYSLDYLCFCDHS